MKARKMSKKLSLKKNTVSDLNVNELMNIRGGAETALPSCTDPGYTEDGGTCYVFCNSYWGGCFSEDLVYCP